LGNIGVQGRRTRGPTFEEKMAKQNRPTCESEMKIEQKTTLWRKENGLRFVLNTMGCLGSEESADLPAE
jgi:hypothetical protein